VPRAIHPPKSGLSPGTLVAVKMIGELLKAGWLAYLGLALWPTPPSPVPDFGLQFLLSLFLGVIAPERVASPVSKFFTCLGRGVKFAFGKIPGIRIIVKKADELYRRWLGWISKDRNSDFRPVDKLYDALGREDLVPRLIFGYFCSILIGSVLVLVAVLTP